ncbi:MAG: heparin lyase I family protein [Ketobacter sp.]
MSRFTLGVRRSTLKNVCKALTASLVLASPLAYSDILYRGDFETGYIKTGGKDRNNSFYYGAFGPNCSNSVNAYNQDNDNRLVSNNVRYGKYANAQTIRYNCNYSSLNNGIHQKPRQALSIFEAQKIEEGKEYWVGLSFKVDSSWVSDHSNNRDNLFQLYKEKNSNGASGRRNAANAINIEEFDGKFRASFRNSYSSSGQSKSYSWPTKKNQWQDVVFNFRMCKKGTKNCNGFIKMYLNGSSKPVFTHSGTNTETDRHKIAMNIYKYSWHCMDASSKTYKQCMANKASTRSTKPRTVYFDELMVGDHNSSIGEIAPYYFGSAPNPPSSLAAKVN